jgi:hypothetical protein
VKPDKPVKFTGDDAVQNLRVESWVEEVNRWLRLSNVPLDRHLDFARSFISSKGSVEEWILQKQDEVNHSNKLMTWDWLQSQLVQHYAQPAGVVALEKQWEDLVMGIKSEDGKDTGKSTRTVESYTNRFLFYMRRLTDHTTQTKDILVLQRYLRGIRDGWRGLYLTMLGVQPVLRFDTLQDAIVAAQLAESELAVARGDPLLSSSSPSRIYGGRSFRTNDRRDVAETINNLQEEYSDEGECEPVSPPPAKPAPRVKLYGFRYDPAAHSDGRYRLSEKEAKMLFEEKRCYRCHQQHPIGRGHPSCPNPVVKTAPKSLKSKK